MGRMYMHTYVREYLVRRYAGGREYSYMQIVQLSH